MLCFLSDIPSLISTVGVDMSAGIYFDSRLSYCNSLKWNVANVYCIMANTILAKIFKEWIYIIQQFSIVCYFTCFHVNLFLGICIVCLENLDPISELVGLYVHVHVTYMYICGEASPLCYSLSSCRWKKFGFKILHWLYM